MRLSRFALVLLFVGITTACTRGESVTMTPSGNYVTLHVRSAGDQLVGMAVGAIVQRYGDIITYEDPGARGVIPPWGSTLSMQLVRAPCGITSLPVDEMMSPDKMVSSLEQLVDRGGGGFRVEKEESKRFGSIIHVIPTKMLDSGKWRGASPLDARISFTAEPRTEDELLTTIVHAVSQATHLRVEFMIGSNIVIGNQAAWNLHPSQFNIGANNETAREVLTRMLEANRYQVQTWFLWHSPEMLYMLYIENVPLPFCA
jgi:hypothetical protein